MVTFSAAHPGTRADDWEADARFAAMKNLDLTGVRQVVVVAAHPDDETLGAGGLIQECARLGIAVAVVVVTDGAASHPDSPTHSPDVLRLMRTVETRAAVATLAPDTPVSFLGYADGETRDYRSQIEADLRNAIADGALIVAPWRRDGHRDHRVVGEICASLAVVSDRTLIEYPIWMWHWAAPAETALPWSDFRVVELTRDQAATKRAAIAQHQSQVGAIGDEPGNEAMLLPGFLENFDRPSEVFVVSGPEPESEASTLSAGYFDDLYSRRDDPWRLATRWYETRKRAATIAALPREDFASGLEIGCSIGTLTAQLAPRVSKLLAVDISQAAVDSAQERVADYPGVTVQRLDVTESMPTARFDLIVLSEVGYYLTRTVLTRLARQLGEHLTADGTLVACHWRHPVDDYPLGGDEVHEILRANLGLTRTVSHVERDFLLEVFQRDERSVAEHEGFI